MSEWQRAPILLVIVAVALIADHLAAGDEDRVHFVPRRDAARGEVRALRPLLWLMTLASALVAALHPWPVGLFSAPLLHAGLSASALHVASLFVAGGHEKPVSLPSTVFAHREGESFLRHFSPPLQLFHIALVIISGLAFRWLLPHLPSVTRAFGGTMISPTKLWWGLSVPALNFALLLFVVWGINRERWHVSAADPAEADLDSDEAQVGPAINERDQSLLDYRRALLARFVEVLLVSINVGALVVWLGAAVGIAEGVRAGLASLTSVAVTGFVGVTLIYCFIRYMVPLARIRQELGERVEPGMNEAGYRLKGAIYFAPEDPALFVPKKRGYGSTLNFGRPSAWLFVCLVTLGPLLLAWWILEPSL